MASPFNVFRRNQRVMMAALVGMSMFAFIFFDPSMMRSGGLPKPLIVLLIAGLCGFGMWFVGQRQGKANEWAMWGALLGAIAAFFYVRTGPSDPTAIHTSFGSFTDQDLSLAGRRRYQANQFVFLAGQKTKSTRPSRGFGPADNRSMLQFKMGQQEARRLGIALDDQAVNRFISDITDDKLSAQSFHEILKEIQVSEGELFNILRDELTVRLAMEVQAPPYDLWTDFDLRSGQIFPRFKLPSTPDEDWRQFEKMNIKQSLALVALPVNDFLKDLKDPPEEELKAFFETRKGLTPGRQGEPGFVQPPRVKLGYLAADFVKFESQAEVPTDDEITAFYEANIERYRIQDIPDFGSDDPADAATPENVLPELPPLDTPAEDKTPEDKPDDKPAVENKQEEQQGEPKSEDKKSEEKKTDAEPQSAVDRPATIRLAKFVQETEEKSADKPAEETSDAKPDDKKTDEEPVKAEVAPENPAKNDAPLMPPHPGLGKDKPAKYRPLDDDLRDRIKEEMLRDRAFQKMQAAADKAQEEMKNFAFLYLDAKEDERKTAAKSIADKLREYAADHGLEYSETPLQSFTELQASTSESIGSAMLPSAGAAQFQGITVTDDVFPRQGGLSPLYFPQRADSRFREKAYAWWKIEDKPQHTPQWTDEGIAEQVKVAWKFNKGRQLAQERAQKLLELAKAEHANLSEVFAGQTVTGESGSDAIVVKETPRFSWLTTSMSTPMDPELGDFMAPRLSFIDGVERPGEDFMQTVFELKPGQAGVAANFDRGVYYVVQPQDRDGTEPPAEVEGFQTVEDLRNKFLALHTSERKEFMVRPYNLLMSNTFSELQQRWGASFNDRYEIQLDQPANGPATAQQ